MASKQPLFLANLLIAVNSTKVLICFAFYNQHENDVISKGEMKLKVFKR